MDKDFYNLLAQMACQPLTNTEDAFAASDRLEDAVMQLHSESGLFDDPATGNKPLRLPSYMKEQIIACTRQPDTIKPPVKIRSKRIELILYSCKVTSAVAACLLMLFATQLSTGEAFQATNTYKRNHTDKPAVEFLLNTPQKSLSSSLSNGSSIVTGWLQDFSSSLLEPLKK